MSSNGTYVFFELGTTWFDDEKCKRDVKILEARLVAVTREQFLDVGAMEWPCGKDFPMEGYLQKLTLRHRKKYATDSCDFSYNEFDIDCFNIIDKFLSNLIEPIYVIAHNGFDFDFYLLKRDLNAIGKSFTKDVMCADSFYAFYDILNNEEIHEESNEVQKGKLICRSAPVSDKMKLMELRQANADRVYRMGRPWSNWNQVWKYGLQAVYERELGATIGGTSSEIRCEMMMQIAVKFSKQFVAWVEQNHSSFAEHVQPLINEANGKTASSGEKANVGFLGGKEANWKMANLKSRISANNEPNGTGYCEAIKANMKIESFSGKDDVNMETSG